jgi:hypothetical protein
MGRLMKILPMVQKLKREAEYKAQNGTNSQEDQANSSNPFGPQTSQAAESPWVVGQAQRTKYSNMFGELKLTSTGKLTGANAKDFMLKSNLPGRTLGLIWELADMDKDGCLDAEEFCVLVYLIEAIKSGVMSEPPNKLPLVLIPPSKRSIVQPAEKANFV